MSVNTNILTEIVALADKVEDKGVLRHLRAAFVRQSNVVVHNFNVLINGVNTVGYSDVYDVVKDYRNGREYRASAGGVTITQTEFDSLVDGKKLWAVKSYKERNNNLPLLESKHAIDDWIVANNFHYVTQ